MKLKPQIRTVTTGVLLLAMCGCASIVSHSTWPMTFNTNPTGAEVTIMDSMGNQIQKGTTPLTLTLKSGNGYFAPASYDMEVKMDGYTTMKGRVSAQVNGWYFGNFFFGGLIGLLAVDPATGAMWKLPPQYSLSLTKTTASNTERQLQIVSLNCVPQDLRSKLVRVK